MKLPVPLNVSGITKIVIDHVLWERHDPRSDWVYACQNGTEYRIKTQEQMHQYLLSLLPTHPNVWPHRDTLNVAKE